MTSFSLAGRVALVTGGSRGIGRSIALALAAAGAGVGVCARSEAGCKEVVAEIEAAGGAAVPIAANLIKEDEIPGAVRAVADHFGRIDVLVNNAGIASGFAPLTSSTTATFDRTFALNVRAPVQLVREAMVTGLGSGGSVVNVASIAGIKSEPMLGYYAASKAAIISTTRTMARELGPLGIRVNVIAPGVIRTDFSKVLVETPELHDTVIRNSALGRVGEPAEVAGAAVWLASDAASFVTGSTIVVDGGLLA